MPAGNVIQQLSTVPVQTPPLVTKLESPQLDNNFTFAWIQWFQAAYQAIKTIPQPTASVPAHPATVVAWLQFQNNGQTYYLPLYQ